MRRIRSHATIEEVATKMPGTTPLMRFRLHDQVLRTLHAAQDAGTSWSSVVLHLEADAVRLRSRSELVAELRDAGVTPLAKEIERALVPRGYFLALLDLEGRTVVNVCELTAAMEQP